MTSHRNKPTPTASCVAAACLMGTASANESDGQMSTVLVTSLSMMWSKRCLMPSAPFPGLALNSSFCSYLSPDTSNQRGVKVAEQRVKLMMLPWRAPGSKCTFQGQTPRKKIAGRSYVAIKTENICLKVCPENINLSVAVPIQTDFLLISSEEPNLLGVMKTSLKQSCLGLVWEGFFSPFSEGRANPSVFRNGCCVSSQLS